MYPTYMYVGLYIVSFDFSNVFVSTGICLDMNLSEQLAYLPIPDLIFNWIFNHSIIEVIALSFGV